MALGVRIILNRQGLSDFQRSQVDRYMLQRGNRVLNGARARVNVDTGYLRSTGTVEQSGDITRVAFRARYARAVHDGHGSYAGNPYLTDALVEEMRR